MRYARYWIPVLAGFALGGLLSWRMSRGSMRELLAASQGDSSGSTAQLTPSGRAGDAGSEFLSDEARFGKLFGALQESRALKRRSEIRSALGDLGAGDMAALLDRAEKMRGAMHSPDLASAILERWFELDSKAAQQWVRNRPSDQSSWLLWAKADPESAFQQVLSNPKGPFAEQMATLAASAMAGGNPAEEGRLLLTLPEGEVRNSLLGYLVRDWSAENSTDVLRFVQTMPPGEIRSALAGTILSDLQTRDLDGAIKALSGILPELKPDQASSRIAGLAGALAGRDPQAALAWLNSLPEENRAPMAYAGIAREWARTDPVAALRWCAANHLNAGDYNPNLSMLGLGQSVVAVAMLANAEQTLQWIRSQPAGAGRDALMEQALKPVRSPFAPAGSIAQNPETLLAALNTLPNEAQARAAQRIGSNYASMGSAKGSEFQWWLSQLQDPAVREAAIVGAGQRTGGNASKREEFVAQFTEPAERDAALEGMAQAQTTYNPKQGAEIATTINDPTRRWQVLDGFMVDWLRKDSKAATQWLDSTKTIPPDWANAWRQEAVAR